MKNAAWPADGQDISGDGAGTIRWFAYVRHADIADRIAEGWTIAADLGPTHGAWAVLMEMPPANAETS